IPLASDGASVCNSVAWDLRTIFSTLVSVFIIASQSQAVFLCHAWVSMSLCSLDTAFVSFECFVSLARPFVGASQHAESVSLVVCNFQITIPGLNQIVVLAGLVI